MYSFSSNEEALKKAKEHCSNYGENALILLVDMDNVICSALYFETMMPPEFFSIAFCGRTLGQPASLRFIRNNFIHLRSETFEKDAADIHLTTFSIFLHLSLDKSVKFVIVTNDHFRYELKAQLSNSGREVAYVGTSLRHTFKKGFAERNLQTALAIYSKHQPVINKLKSEKLSCEELKEIVDNLASILGENNKTDIWIEVFHYSCFPLGIFSFLPGEREFKSDAYRNIFLTHWRDQRVKFFCISYHVDYGRFSDFLKRKHIGRKLEEICCSAIQEFLDRKAIVLPIRPKLSIYDIYFNLDSDQLRALYREFWIHGVDNFCQEYEIEDHSVQFSRFLKMKEDDPIVRKTICQFLIDKIIF